MTSPMHLVIFLGSSLSWHCLAYPCALAGSSETANFRSIWESNYVTCVYIYACYFVNPYCPVYETGNSLWNLYTYFLSTDVPSWSVIMILEKDNDGVWLNSQLFNVAREIHKPDNWPMTLHIHYIVDHAVRRFLDPLASLKIHDLFMRHRNAIDLKFCFLLLHRSHMAWT